MNKIAKNTARKQRGRPFVKGKSGNPCGRPAGSLNRVTKIAQALLDNDVEEIFKTLISNAKQGDPSALRIAVERILPPRRDRHVSVVLPKIKNASDAASAMATLINEVAAGSITAGEAEGLTKLIGDYSKILEISQFEERLKRLEEATA